MLVAIEEASEHRDRRVPRFLDELNRCQESARNALMPALDSRAGVFHPIENTFIPIPDNVQFIAAVNRGREFTGTFGIDAAQLDRFAPLQMDYPPPTAEVEILARRHPNLPAAKLEVRSSRSPTRSASAPDLPGSLSVRATDEACIYLEHPLFAEDGKRALPEILKTSFCARFPGPLGRHHDGCRRGVGRGEEDARDAARAGARIARAQATLLRDRACRDCSLLARANRGIEDA